ncbi:MAG: hypothetical protein Q8P57_02465 [Candidatus Pacearchaeota archaeon]|nr:hypothetical protein [Candidatus Pacearchaeota archaeon]
MRQEQLLDAFRRVSEVTHDPAANRTTKRNARKEAILAELETAHFLMYQQRAERAEKAIQAELDRQAQLKDIKKEINENSHKKNLENLYLTNSNYYPNIESFPKKKFDFDTLESEDPKVTAKRNMALNLARTAVHGDRGLVKFRQILDRLERVGDESTLESLLNAAHNMSVTAPHSAQQFLSTMETIPEEDRAPYATIVSHLFRDQTHPMGGGNPLIWRLSQIQPRLPERDSDLSPKRDYVSKFSEGREERDYNSIFIEPLKTKSINKYEDDFEKVNSLVLAGSGSALKDVQLGLTHGIGYAGHIESDRFSSKGNTSFFGELQEIYRRVGAEKAREWLKQATAFFEEDQKLGRDFAVRSRPAFVAYQNDLRWDLDQFVDDYRKMGDAVFELAGFSSKFAGLGNERRRNVARSLISTISGAEIKELTTNKLPTEQVALVGDRLPEEATPHEIITAVKRTANLYEQFDQRRLNNGFVTSRIGRVQRVGSLDDYLKAVSEIGQQADRYMEFVDEQRRDPNMNLGFNDSQAQATLDLYEAFLGKNFDQFKRDFTATGTAFQRLPQIRDQYGEHMPEEKLRAVMNYIAKQRSRDLIDDLSRSTATSDLIGCTISRLGDGASKKEIVKALAELNKTYNFLQNVGATEILTNRLNGVSESAGYNLVLDAISGSRRECYSVVIGGAEVPQALEDMVDNIVVAYYKNTGTSNGVNIRPALEMIASSYLQHGPQETFQAIRDLEPNRKVRKTLEKRGVNIEAFEKGMEKTYHVSTDEGSLARIRERIDAEVGQVWDRLKLLYTSNENETDEEVLKKKEELRLQVEELRQGSLREQLDNVEKLVGQYEFDDKTKALKPEIKGHIQTARSMTGSIKEMEADARFYVSQDPFEALHQGQYFRSCLSLAKNHGGTNGWASVVQTMDSNKNVIYARAKDGRYLGRNRTALTDQGVLCTQFYQNGDMNLNNAWVDYLGEFANHTGQDVMIPTTFAPGSMASLLEGKATREQRSVRIEPAYFSAFYGDGVPTRKLEDGAIRVDTEVYVLRPSTPYMDKSSQTKDKQPKKRLLSGLFRRNSD